MGKLLRREGFIDLEPRYENFSDLPDGAVLVSTLTIQSRTRYPTVEGLRQCFD